MNKYNFDILRSQEFEINMHIGNNFLLQLNMED